MKKIMIIVLTAAVVLSAALIKNIPVTVTQPDGTEISLFSSGDEFFNRLHDEDDFTIIQGKDGWYYYAVRSGDDVVPSTVRAGNADPASSGIERGAKISERLYRQRVEAFNNFETPKNKAVPTTGTINNLVIFIRFSDEEESIFRSERSYYDTFFSRTDGSSLYHYFREVSYNQLDVYSTYYPHVDDFSTNLSFQDIYPRSYYQPYHATNNPDGYKDSTERRIREHSLLERAVIAVRDEVPEDLVIDSSGDGNVDSVVFLISGSPGQWASLLWPHKWSLWSYDVRIHGKRVWDYNFNLTGSSTYFNVGVVAHEFFHTLGAPDLYRYSDQSITPVGPWDIMSHTTSTPQYMGAWMKYKYGKWIDPPQIISEPGEYTLNPLTSDTDIYYRINSPDSSTEYFIVEYRKQTGIYETNLPGTSNGMLIYRIRPAVNGNAQGPPDEVYIFRVNGTPSTNGTINSALFSSGLGRVEFNSLTNPYPFLSNGTPGGISIYNIGEAGETISFRLAINVLPPANPVAASVGDGIEINWSEPDDGSAQYISHYVVYRDGNLLADEVEGTSYTDTSVALEETYIYSVSAVYAEGESMQVSTDEITYLQPLTAPYETDFASTDRWSQVSVNCTPRWISSSSSRAGGSSPEMRARIENAGNAVSRLISPAVSTNDIDTLLISFRHFYDGYPTWEEGIRYKVEISRNKYDWTDTYWSFEGTSSNVGPELVEIELTEFPDPVYVSWTLEGHFFSYDGWYIDDVDIREKGTSSIGGESNLPLVTLLHGNYPNPFNPETNVTFDLGQRSDVSLKIYDSRGSLVRVLENRVMEAGSHSIVWDGANDLGRSMASGIYYIRLTAGNQTFTHRSLMIK